MLTNKFMDDGFSPHACAAIMTKLAMMIYKTTLDAEDYNSMINSIADSRNMIKSFTDYRRTGRLN
jgi:hypothetical protein